jgi:membrane protease YdiL (CAAX protease family)
MNNTSVDATGSRIGWLERPNEDFPYYNGRPVGLSGQQWILLMIAASVGFMALVNGLGGVVPSLSGWLPVALYSAIPLGALMLFAGKHWTALFWKVSGKDILLMFLFALLTIAVMFGVGAILVNTTETTQNTAVASIADKSSAQILLFYMRSAVQLFGEELMTILPFLFIMYLFAGVMKTGRVTAIFLAWLLTGVLFAIQHLPTYGWNLVQAFGGVGIVRLVLTLPYIMTKNIWVSTGAHVLNDWFTFSFTLFATSMHASTA